MSDSSTQDVSHGEKPYLWIPFLCLFLILLSISLYVFCHRACCFCDRYCICQCRWGWCCVMDVDAYRRERESLRRLRELRRLEELRQIRHTNMATFTQIPGPIPDSFVDLRQRAAISNFHSLGFILVTAPVAARPRRVDANSMQQRDQLTGEQRRDILERILSCRTYHVTTEELMTLEEEEEEEHSRQKQMQESLEDAQEESTPAPQTYAIPLHEEPETPENTCAICLDDFIEGEKINDASKCPHVFHKACLIEWLDKHDVCPCCRCTMITDTEWRRAASDRRLRHDGENSVQQPTEPTTMPSVEVENVATTHGVDSV